MNYYNTSSMDFDSWLELEKVNKQVAASKKNIPREITVLRENLQPTLALGQGSAGFAGNQIPKVNNWAYFITLSFPTNQKFVIKHLEPHVHVSRIVFKPIKYGECTQDEQYHWILHILKKHINLICEIYDLFFEQTSSGNIHIHGRINFVGKKKPMKDISALCHRIFGVPLACYAFTDVKVYEEAKWNDYHDKKVKTYQTLDYPHFKNI